MSRPEYECDMRRSIESVKLKKVKKLRKLSRGYAKLKLIVFINGKFVIYQTQYPSRVLIWLSLALIGSYIAMKYTEIISVVLLLQMAIILTEIKPNSVNRCAIIATRI